MAVSHSHGGGRLRMLTASALTVTVAAVASYAAPRADANLPVERGHRGVAGKVKQVKVDRHLFGVHDSFANSLHRAGTGSIRLWDTGVQWKDIFPTAGNPDWTHLDDLVTQAHDNGTEVTLVLGLTPSYAGATPTSMPDTGMYQSYVHDVMDRYSPANWQDADGHHYRGIAAYQVWNEANIGTFWTGGYDGLGQLVKIAAKVRTSVDPGAKIVAPAMVTRLGYQQKGIKDFFKTKVGTTPVWKYVDAISLNLYPLDSYPQPNPKRAGTPEDSMALLKTVRGILSKDGVPASKPIWNTEINYGLTFGSNAGQPAVPISEGRQVAYVIRTYLLNAAQGVQRVYWYAYDMDARGSLGPLGNTLLTDPADRAAGTLLPPGRAFTRVQAWMKGTLVGTATKKPCIRDSHGTYTCTIRYARGMGRVYWNPYRTAKVTLVRSATKKVDEFGVTSRAKGGTKLKVSYKPVLVKSKR